MLISEAWAQAAGGAGGSDFLVQLFPLVLIFIVFYFLLIRPQQAKMRQQREMLAGVKRGDRVVAYLPNTPDAVVALFAVASIGAIWSVCSPLAGGGVVTAGLSAPAVKPEDTSPISRPTSRVPSMRLITPRCATWGWATISGIVRMAEAGTPAIFSRLSQFIAVSVANARPNSSRRKS